MQSKAPGAHAMPRITLDTHPYEVLVQLAVSGNNGNQETGSKIHPEIGMEESTLKTLTDSPIHTVQSHNKIYLNEENNHNPLLRYKFQSNEATTIHGSRDYFKL